MRQVDNLRVLQKHAFVVTGLGVLALFATRSFVITIALVSVVFALLSLSREQRENKYTAEISSAIPEIIESVLSAIQSGLSLTEALIALGKRGPIVTQGFFQNFEVNIKNGVSFEESISTVQDQFRNRLADQLFEAMIFASSLGGSELHSVLREIGLFTRADLAVREEITSKQSWVRNSAHIAAAAPWILLVFLSLQPATAASFSSTSGALLLSTGVALTLIAYRWMNQIAKIPQHLRIFGSNE